MQPSQASNLTRVPRQVQERLDRSVARYTPTEPETDPAANPDPATPPSGAAPNVDPQPNTPALDPRDSDPSYWKHRFNVTDGILKRERIESRNEQQRLQQRASELEVQLRTPSATQTNAVLDLTKYFSPADIERYGEDQCRTMATIADKAASDKAKELVDAAVQPLKDAKTRDDADRATAAMETLWENIDRLDPRVRLEDTDPRWHAWLNEIDLNTESPHRDLLNMHISRGNAAGCVRMFKEWKATTVAAAPPPPPPAPPPLSPSGSGASGDAGQSVVKTGADGAALTYPSKGEIKAHYTKSALGKVSDQERVAFEARLAAKPH